MTLEESKEVIPMMEAMITQIEEQQNIMAELLQILPDTEELLILLEEKTAQIQQLTDENQQWQELAQRLNSENRVGNIQALKNDLRKTKELLQSEKEKTHAAEIMTEECQDKLRQAEQERYDTQREKLAGRYKAKTAMYEALMFLLIWYSVSTTLFQIILSKIFISDCVDKDNIANQSAISLIIRATGICWNQVVCKGMARNKGILLKNY